MYISPFKINEDVDLKPTTKLIGLTKEQLEQYRNDPFWKAVRYGLFILFWLVWLAMFVGAILIVVLSPKCAAKIEPKWHENLVGYKIFTPTFKDSDGDGVGDFKGIMDKLNDLRKIGVSAIWPTPIVKTNKDVYSTEEVTDILAIDPRYGTVDDLKALIDATHSSNLQFIVDLPLTISTSDNSWAKSQNFTVDGGTVGTAALLDVSNTEVQNKLLEAAKKFLLMGVDGFCLTDYGLSKKIPTTNSPNALIERLRRIDTDDQIKQKEVLIFTGEGLQNGNIKHEATSENYHLMPLSESDGTSKLSLIEQVEENIKNGLEKIRTNGSVRPMWRLGSLNSQRIDQQLISEPGLKEHKIEVSALLTMIQLFLPGPVDILYGEELALPSAKISSNTKPQQIQRIIQQWDSGRHFGFSSIGAQLFFPPAENARGMSFEEQFSNTSSPLKAFKRMAELRTRDSVFQQGDCSFKKDGLHIYTRFIPDSPSEYVYVLAVNWPVDGKSISRKLTIDPTAIQGKSLAKVEVKVPSALNTDNSPNQELNLESESLEIKPFQAVVLRIV